MYTINVDPRVKEDLKDASTYLNAKRKGVGSKFLKEYRDVLKTLQNNPLFQLRYKEIHCLPMKNFKYMIHFTVNEQNKEVLIYAVLSTHQDPNKHWF